MPLSSMTKSFVGLTVLYLLYFQILICNLLYTCILLNDFFTCFDCCIHAFGVLYFNISKVLVYPNTYSVFSHRFNLFPFTRRLINCDWLSTYQIPYYIFSLTQIHVYRKPVRIAYDSFLRA